jgi:ammonia channel protein AmtB
VFYGGLVRRKNVLAIMLQRFISMGVVTIIWVAVGYLLAFSGSTGCASAAPADRPVSSAQPDGHTAT